MQYPVPVYTTRILVPKPQVLVTFTFGLVDKYFQVSFIFFRQLLVQTYMTTNVFFLKLLFKAQFYVQNSKYYIT